MITELHENGFFEFLREHPLVLVDFWANWCPPCKMMAPVLEQLDREVPDISVAKVDVDAYPGLSARYGVRSIPNMVIFKNGEPADRVIGVTEYEALKNTVLAHR